MKKKLFIILGVLVLSITILFSYIVKDNREENNKEISKVEKLLSKPEGIQAYTLNGENTNISYNDLIEEYEIDSITCKNGTIATYNKEDNSVSLSNVHMPDYCTMDFKLGTYTITIDAGGGYFGNPTEINDGYSDVVVLQKGVSVPVATGNTLNLTPNQKYMLSFDYWSGGGSVEFDVDLFPDTLPQIYPVATTTPQTMNWIFSSSSSDMASSQIRYFNDRTVPNPQEIAIINKHLYKCDDCTLTYTKDVTKGNAYGSLNTPKRYGWDFLGWYLEDGTKVESTSINNIKGNHTITAKWSEHYYQVKLVGVNGTIGYAPIWNYRAGWENASTKITANNGYTTKGATVSCTGSAGASISGDYLYLRDVIEDQTCTVTFKKLTYNVTLSVVNGSGSTTKTAEHGSSVSFTVTPSSGYQNVLETNTCGGTLSGNTYTISNIKENKSCSIGFKKATLAEKLLADNPTRKTRTDFNTTFTETNTGTLYKATESIAGSTPKDVYYFAGNAKNNWVKFGGFYWRIIRTNHDGSVRLLYSGTSPDTTNGYIGESKFNSEYKSPKYAGYMYGNSDATLDEARTNANNSTIKTYIDNWYSANLSGYTKYISTEAVYCNDRELASGQTYSTKSRFNYIIYTRLNYDGKGAKANPTYNCAVREDAFSGSTSDGGNGKLTYPIALMTADEINIAGGLPYHPAPAYYYLNSAGGSITGSTWWWSLSPNYWDGSNTAVWHVAGSWQFLGNNPGYFNNKRNNETDGVRPAISIKSCALWSSGNGSSSSPYEINGGC